VAPKGGSRARAYQPFLIGRSFTPVLPVNLSDQVEREARHCVAFDVSFLGFIPQTEIELLLVSADRLCPAHDRHHPVW
jgi:hypothetical protein